MLGLRHYKKIAIDLFHGDIIEFVCDAMVTAANEQLAVGGGVDGAIHKAGGPSLFEECQQIGHCPVGQCVATTPGRLPAKGLIHAVGPIWRGGNFAEEQLLRSAYVSSLALATQRIWPHIAFPSISTGAYAFPVEKAAPVAMRAVKEYLDQEKVTTNLRRITFVLFDRETYQTYQKALFEIFPELDEASP